MTEMDMTDNEILAAVKKVCEEVNYSPSALIAQARATVEWSKTAVISPFGPYPQGEPGIDDAEITQEILDGWPDWVQDLVPAGSKWERLHWPDGSKTVRLVTPRARVLAAQHFLPGEEGTRRV